MKRSPDGILSRSLAGIFGGYLSANLIVIALTQWTAKPEVNAVIIGMLASYTLYCIAVVWAFAAKSASQAWQGLLFSSGLALIIWAGAAVR